MNQHLCGTSILSKDLAELCGGWKDLHSFPSFRPKGSFQKLEGRYLLLSLAWTCVNNQDVNLL